MVTASSAKADRGVASAKIMHSTIASARIFFIIYLLLKIIRSASVFTADFTIQILQNSAELVNNVLKEFFIKTPL